MLVTEFISWLQLLNKSARRYCKKLVQKDVGDQSCSTVLTFYSCQQHISSPTSVTNIDVTLPAIQHPRILFSEILRAIQIDIKLKNVQLRLVTRL